MNIFYKTCAFILMVLMHNIAEADVKTSLSGWEKFSYPSGWRIEVIDYTKSRYIENFLMQPPGQDFSGKENQIAVRVYDPFYVIEEANVSFKTDPETIFKSFIQSMPDETQVNFSKIKLNEVNYIIGKSTSQGIKTTYLGKVGRLGYLNVVGAAGESHNGKTALDYLHEIIITYDANLQSIDDPAPATAVAQWYKNISSGNAVSVRTLACKNAQALMGIISLFGLSNGNGDPLTLITSAGVGFDYSDLRFLTYKASNDVAVVRISGTVKDPRGRRTPFGQYAKTFGSNMITVRKESGSWKVCEPVKGR